MIFKELTYRQKQTGLIVLTVIVLILFWFISFRRTYQLARECIELSESQELAISSPSNFLFLREKARLQDSILSTLSNDSLTWSSNLLTQVSNVISSEEIRVIFENKSLKNAPNIVEREIVLVGEFNVLLTALKQVEEIFYINSLIAFKEKDELKYKLRLSVLNTKSAKI